MAIANFNDPIGLVSLATASPAEREALAVSTPFQRFGRRGLAGALGAQRLRALDALRGDIREGNLLRAGLEQQALGNERFGDILGVLGAEPLASRVFDPLSTLATFQQTGEIPFSEPLDQIGNILRQRAQAAGVQNELAQALERANQAGVNVPQGGVVDLLSGVAPELVRERGLSERALAAANVGRSEVTRQFVGEVPEATGGVGTITERTVQPGATSLQSGNVTTGGTTQGATPQGVQLSGAPINDPDVAKATTSVSEALSEAGNPQDFTIQYVPPETTGGRKILIIVENITGETQHMEVLPGGELQRVIPPGAQSGQ